MNEGRESVGTPLLVFLAGAALGATVVALTTPKTFTLSCGPRRCGEVT